MNYREHIEIVAGKRNGKPCLKNSRISVYDVLGWMAQGMTANEIIEDFPELNTEKIQACLSYAAEREHHLTSIHAA
ncbi:DUF433 domain-containing protein [Porticoccus sp. GXU_MW_L64]